MAITKKFKETVQARAAKDAEYREGLLTEGISLLLSGDTSTGKSLIRDYINSTIGFESLAKITQKSPKSLMRMLSPEGNPTANNLFNIIGTLQKKENINPQIIVTTSSYDAKVRQGLDRLLELHKKSPERSILLLLSHPVSEELFSIRDLKSINKKTSTPSKFKSKSKHPYDRNEVDRPLREKRV